MPTTNELSANETVAAQLAIATSSIVIDNVHTVDIVNNTTNTNDPVSISVANFKKAFYGDVASGNDATFKLVTSDADAAKFYNIQNFARVNGSVDGDADYWVYGATAAGINLPHEVTAKWADDTCPLNAWSTCSKMAINNEIATANNLRNLDCNINCSLSWCELLALLDSQQPISGGGATTRTELQVDDLVGVRILFTNGNTATKPVEVRVHYKIIA